MSKIVDLWYSSKKGFAELPNPCAGKTATGPPALYHGIATNLLLAQHKLPSTVAVGIASLSKV